MTKQHETLAQRVIVALDHSTKAEALALVEQLGEATPHYKVGLELFLNSHGTIVDELAALGKSIFLDLKFHDIPNTTTMAALFAAKAKCQMFNVHASGGRKMMQAVAEQVKALHPELAVIAVTLLTSFDEAGVQETFSSTLSLPELALNLARLTKESGLDGVVCSPWEAAAIKAACGSNFRTVCPGVRPAGAAQDDQERIMTPAQAIEAACDYLVIGRPITRHPDPKAAFAAIIAEMEA